MIVGLCGLAGAGKDTLARHLAAHHGFARLSFGAVLKDVVAALFGWDRYLLEGDTEESRAFRERVDPWWSERLDTPDFSPRRALQIVGTDVFRRHFADGVWVSAVEKRLSCHDRVVVTDCRFPNEIDMVRRHGGIVVHVRRPDCEPTWLEDYMRTGSAVVIPADVHVSEFAWVLSRFDAQVLNEGTESLRAFGDRLVSQVPAFTCLISQGGAHR